MWVVLPIAARPTLPNQLLQTVRAEAALPTARIMQRLAQETEEGFGNFRFAMLACPEPGCPFFPAAYHSGPTSLSLGLQGAGLLTQVLQKSSRAIEDKAVAEAKSVDLFKVSEGAFRNPVFPAEWSSQLAQEHHYRRL